MVLREKTASLVDLIGLALNKRTYEGLVRNIEKGWDVSHMRPEANSELARNHRSKILREETERQFRESYRPIVEIILNAIDARPRDHHGPYEVNVKTNGRYVEVSDAGTGMELEGILTTLLIPFSSNKDSSTDIGRFGVGFFSSLGFCTREPKKAGITVDTGRYSSRYIINIHSDSASVDDLRCSIQKEQRPEQGTRVRIQHTHDKKQMTDYIARYLRSFDSSRAVIKVNGKAINLPKKNKKFSSSESHSISFETKKGNRSYLRFCLDPAKKRGCIDLYSQGVEICTNDVHGYEARIDLPSDILLVEGRDEFKRDLSYTNALLSVIGFGCDNQNDLSRRFKQGFEMREFIPDLVKTAQLNHPEIKDAISRYARTLFPLGTYIVRDLDGLEASVDIADFLGDDVSASLYAPSNLQAFNFWSIYLPGISTILGKMTTAVETDIEELIRSYAPLAQSAKEVRSKRRDFKLNPVILNECSETRSPFLSLGGALYMNVQHSLLSQDDFMSRYMTRHYLLRALEDDKKAEDMLIR
ncbi:MAG: ATP-binding protein [Candidatus Woesearchaeota archaeon]